MDPCDRVTAILEQMMAKSDDNKKTIKKLMDAIRAETKAIQARRKAIHNKTDANQTRLEPETEHQEKMEPNPGERAAVVERQEVPNEEASIHSLRARRKEMIA
jgi:hypothetical protein